MTDSYLTEIWRRGFCHEGSLPGAGNVDDEPLESVSAVDVDHDEGVEDVSGLVSRVAEMGNQGGKNGSIEGTSKPWDTAVKMDVEHREWSGSLQTPERRLQGTCTYIQL